MALHIVNAQPEIGLSGKQFFALSVGNADSTSAWYEYVFQLKLLKEIKTPDGAVHVRIVGNDDLLLEIIQPKDSKTLADAGVDPGQPFKLQGIFKVGIYVRDIKEAEKYLRQKNAVIKHGAFDDKDTQTTSLVIEDVNRNLIQIIQRP